MSAELGVEVKTEKTVSMAECKKESEPKAPGAEEEEDIPPDFFDDFSNQDFMEGLDIVDTWDDEMPEEGECAKDDSQNGADEEKGKKSEGDTAEVKKDATKHERVRITYSKERELRLLKYERSQRYRDLREKIGRPEEARRRDPEKTRRDILRDKDRCEKDKEVRIIKEKLKVVETGLVPPGMEMEVDLADIRSQQNIAKPKVEPRPIIKPKIRSRSRSYERYRYRERPLRSRSRSRSRDRRRLRDDSSPRKRLRSRSRSRYRSVERIPSKERKSPRRRTRDSSRSSELSDREKWLTKRYRRSPSPRRRSISPDRKRSDNRLRRSDPEPRETKPSFLEEIHKKFNETVLPATQIAVQQAIQLRANYSAAAAAAAVAVPPAPPAPVVIQTALPVPPSAPAQLSFPSQIVAPVQYDQTVVSQQQYDQQFFIGTCDMPIVAQPAPQPVSAPALYGQPAPVPVPPPGAAVPTMPSLPLNHGLSPSTSHQSPNTIAHRIEVNSLLPSAAKLAKDKKALEETDKRALSKLLEDKKISLSDFLTITARPTASRTPNLQEKISVISRCQDAIKELGGDVTSGRLFIKRYPKPETSEPRQYASPLRKIPIVRLNYTSLVKPDGDAGFSTILKKLLQSVCVSREIEDARKAQQNAKVRPRTKRRQYKEQVDAAVAATAAQTVDATTPATHLTKMCQTEPYKCHRCQVRAARMFQDQMVQCEIKKYVDASTQTAAEESTPVKSKSLSHMTPAEILAEVEKNKETGLRIPKVEPRSDESEEEETPDAAGILQNSERSVELDHGDKDFLDPRAAGDEKYTVWNRGAFSPRSGRRGGGSTFRGSRGFKSSRGRKPFYKDDFDIFTPNFDDDEEYVFNRSVPPDQQFRSFDDNYYNQSGPSNQRPFFEPPDHIKRKFNRRFL